jgi:hypothetical protein
MEKITKVKAKKEFNELPDSVVERALNRAGGDVKKARALLRKYFGAFLVNKVLRAEGEEVLKSHISTRKRNYEELYRQVVDNEKSVVDLGCGVNGFSYGFFSGQVNYVGVEAVGQLVEKMNNYFEKNNFNAHAVHADVFDLGEVEEILKKQEKPCVVFMFQLIDALEFFKRDFSKELIMLAMSYCDKIVLSWALKSLSGKKNFKVSRGWLIRFIKENFEIADEFVMRGEKFLIIKNKN